MLLHCGLPPSLRTTRLIMVSGQPIMAMPVRTIIVNKGGFTAHILVGGAAVWLEFGTGVVANPVGVGGYAHPMAAELGMYGIGEFGHGHGADPNGWWYYDETGRKRHTFGIPATMFMYHSAWNARRDIPYLARRIWS